MTAVFWTIVLAVVLVAVVGGWYLSYTAARLDRLHAKIAGSWQTVESQLVRRAEAILELANSGWLDAASSFLLTSEATDVLDLETDDPKTRIQLENDLAAAATTVVAETLDDPDADDADADELELVRTADRRVQLAASFHNEAVREVVEVRGKLVIRVFRLAGHAALPEPIDMHKLEIAAD